jgi:uncharacterized protein YPO0396
VRRVAVKRLRRFRLINWHRFVDYTQEVNDTLVLIGSNRAGKSTILDAFQIALVGDASKVRFNAAANESTDRNLSSYIRGKVSHGTGRERNERYLRSEGCVSYVLLEFVDTDTTTDRFVLGVVMEAYADNTCTKEHFIANETGIDDMPCRLDGAWLGIREFHRAAKGIPKLHWYAEVGKYKDAVRQRLGRLHEDFVRLFVKSLSFKPITNVRDFAYDYLLDPYTDIGVVDLRDAVDQYNEMHQLAGQARERIALLSEIDEKHNQVRSLEGERDLYQFLAARAVLGKKKDAAVTAMTRLEECRTQSERQMVAYEEGAKVLEEAKAFLEEAKRRLNEHSVYKDYTNLQERIGEQKATFAEYRGKETQLRAGLDLFHGFLSAIPGMDLEELPAEIRVSDEETEILNRFWIVADKELSGEEMRPELVDGAAEDAENCLRGIYDRFVGAAREIGAEIKKLNEERSALEAELKDLEGGIRKYPISTDRLRQLIRQDLGVKAEVFCELLEVTDEAWRDAVEGYLDGYRFDLLVPPETYDKSLSVYESRKQEHRLEGVGLVNTQRAKDAKGCLPGSLAEVVEAKNPFARAYADSLMGTLMRCDSERDLKKHNRSITRTVMIYQNHVARQKPFHVYQKTKVIGVKGIEFRKTEIARILHENGERWIALRNREVALTGYARKADGARTGPERLGNSKGLVDRMNQIKNHLAELQARFVALDVSDFETLNADVARAKETVEKAERRNMEDYGEAQKAKERYDRATEMHRSAVAEERAQSGDLDITYPPDTMLRAEGERDYAERRKKHDNDYIETTFTGQARNRETQAGNERLKEASLRSQYNANFQFGASTTEPEEIEKYRAEKVRWEDTKLPSFESQIAQAKETALHVLEEDVIHRLREKMVHAKKQFNDLNKAMKGIDFSGCAYKFVIEPKLDREYKEFYDMIMDAGKVEDAPLLQTVWKQQYAEGPLQTLLEEILNDRGKKSLDALEKRTDYRVYFDYDVEITDLKSGETSSFSRLTGSGSGGETQTPYYVAMLASMARIYRTQEEGSRFGLVAFDECFQKMDESNTAGVIELARKLKLQLALATPKERIPEILPHLREYTCLLVLREGDQVFAEPFTKEMLESMDPSWFEEERGEDEDSALPEDKQPAPEAT